VLGFSKDVILFGDTVKIYARVFNTGDIDMSGFVSFLNNGKEIASPQPVSLKPNTYDDVFVDWKPGAGTYTIEATIVGINTKDDNVGNNTAIKKQVLVDLDTDHDGIGDSNDPDIDGDSLTVPQESILGTSPKKADTDGDGVNDNIDAFPLNKTEWRDTNKNGVGDNKDPDIDGDGVSNKEENLTYGTNPFAVDSDEDGISDGQEIKDGTNPNKANTAKKVLDFNLGNLQTKASDYVNGSEKYFYIGGVLLFLWIVWLLLKKKKRR
jgi:hypothetical protein